MKNKKLQNILFTVAIIVGIGVIALMAWLFTKDNTYTKYVNKQYSFSLMYPTGWDLSEGQNGTVVQALSPNDNDLDFFRENFNVVVQDITQNPMMQASMQNPGGKSVLLNYSGLAIAQMKKVFDDSLHIIKQGETSFAGLKGYQFVYRAETKEGIMLRFKMIWALNETTAYQFTFVSLDSTYSEYEDNVNKMVNSFKVIR